MSNPGCCPRRRLALNPNEVPTTVKSILAAHCGTVHSIQSMAGGTSGHSTFSVESDRGPMFCKAVHETASRSWMAEREATVNPHLPAVAPRLLWSGSAAGWSVNAFELVAGRPASLVPGSPDLPLITDTLVRVAVDVSSWPIRVQPVSHRWRERTWGAWCDDPPGGLDPWLLARLSWLAEQEALAALYWDGCTLIHNDPAAANFLVDGDTVWLVDWSWPGQGPAWVDAVLVALRLIASGHVPADAEVWACTVPAFVVADPVAVTGFLVHRLGMLLARRPRAPHVEALCRAAKAWLCHRAREV